MATIDCRSERLLKDDEHATPIRATVAVHRPRKESIQENVTTGGRAAVQIYSQHNEHQCSDYRNHSTNFQMKHNDHCHQQHNEQQSNYDLFEGVKDADSGLNPNVISTTVPSVFLEANNCSPSLLILSSSSSSSTSSSSSCSLISSKCPSFSISSSTSSTSAFSSPSVERKCLKENKKTYEEKAELARITYDKRSLIVPTFDGNQAASVLPEDDQEILNTTVGSSTSQRTHSNQLHVVHTLNSFVGVGRRGVTSGFGSQVPIAAFVNPTNWLLCRRFQESGDTFNSLPLFVFATSTTTRSISADGIGVSKALLPVQNSAQFHILHHRQQRLRIKVSFIN